MYVIITLMTSTNCFNFNNNPHHYLSYCMYIVSSYCTYYLIFYGFITFILSYYMESIAGRIIIIQNIQNMSCGINKTPQEKNTLPIGFIVTRHIRLVGIIVSNSMCFIWTLIQLQGIILLQVHKEVIPYHKPNVINYELYKMKSLFELNVLSFSQFLVFGVCK